MIINPFYFSAAGPVTVVGSTQRVENTSGLSTTVTSGAPSSGQLIILHLAYGRNLTSPTAITWPSGFTQGERREGVRASGAWAWKVAVGSEPSNYTVAWASGSTRSILTCIKVANHGGIGGSSSALFVGNTNNVTSPSFFSTPANSLRIALISYGWGGGTVTTTPPVLFPAVVTLHAGVFTSSGNEANGTGALIQSREETNAFYPSYTNTISWSENSGGVHNCAFTVAIARL